MSVGIACPVRLIVQPERLKSIYLIYYVKFLYFKIVATQELDALYFLPLVAHLLPEAKTNKQRMTKNVDLERNRPWVLKPN